MSLFKSLRKVVKVIGLLDSLLDEFERETAAKQAESVKSRDRVVDLYKEASDLLSNKGKN